MFLRDNQKALFSGQLDFAGQVEKVSLSVIILAFRNNFYNHSYPKTGKV